VIDGQRRFFRPQLGDRLGVLGGASRHLPQRDDLFRSHPARSRARPLSRRASAARIFGPRQQRDGHLLEPRGKLCRIARTARVVSAMLTSVNSASAVVIGGSAGAIQSLLHLLPPIPANSLVPIVIVVHLPPRRPSLLTELFSDRCALPVREPCDK